MLSLSPFNLCLLALLLALLVITAREAGRKGYRPALWFFAGGLIGLLIVVLLPCVNERSKLPEAKRKTWRMAGNLIGGVISAIGLLWVIVNLLIAR
jgi:hypothetical protein